MKIKNNQHKEWIPSPRTGRPIKGDSKRDQRLELRISKDEMNLLDECVDKLNMSRADTVVSLVKKELEKCSKL